MKNSYPMKYLSPIVMLLFIVGCNTTKSTDRLLNEIWQKDQNIRHQMIALTKAVTTEGQTELIDSLISISAQMDIIDAQNMAVIDSLLSNGLPSDLSAESYRTIWIVIDHSSLEKQERYLPLIEHMATSGLIGSDDYATLFDRVAMKQNRPQRYGSQSVQFGTPEAMQLYIWPVENPEKLDSLRLSVGMSPLDEYLNTLSATTGIEAKFCPAITVEQLNRMRYEQ